MIERKTLVAVLTATTFLTAGVAFAADQAEKPVAQQQTPLEKDAGKLSADGARAYNDIALARLAIFDGRVKAAKTFVDEANSSFDKAKSDDSVFMKAEADFKSPGDKGAPNDDKTASTDKGATDANGARQEQSARADAMTTPKRWVPVDADMSVDEDFAASPKKAAAVADANKSLGKGDKKGAMEKLKLANVSMTYAMAVVPLDQTLADVRQAAQLVDGGKYYEASQMLRQVQDSTRYDVLVADAAPEKKAEATKPDAATH